MGKSYVDFSDALFQQDLERILSCSTRGVTLLLNPATARLGVLFLILLSVFYEKLNRFFGQLILNRSNSSHVKLMLFRDKIVKSYVDCSSWSTLVVCVCSVVHTHAQIALTCNKP